jgi:Na+-driven multidrug efflux pump
MRNYKAKVPRRLSNVIGSLGMQDSMGPLKSLAIASAVNLAGDIFLCTVMGYGIAGAAWATMASQYVAAFLMMNSLHVRGYNVLAISSPSWKEFVHMVNLAAPILLTMISKVTFYTLITYLATTLGAVALAAHQVCNDLWFT